MNKFTKIAFVFGLLFFGSFSFADGNVTDDSKVINGSNEDANATTQKELTLAKADTSTDDWDDDWKEPDFDWEEKLKEKSAALHQKSAALGDLKKLKAKSAALGDLKKLKAENAILTGLIVTWWK